MILELLRNNGRVDVVGVAEQLAVAPETVRRDLRALEQDGRLVRVHGGAVPPASPVPSQAHPGPPGSDPTLAAAAWAQLPRNGTVLIGAGTHCTALAEAMVADPPSAPGLQVVTYALDVAVTLSRVTQLRVFNVGGIVSVESRAQEGDWALTELRRFHVDVAVMSPVGVTPTALWAATPAAAAVAREAVGVADSVMVLADRTTAGRHGHVEFAPLGVADVVLLSGPSDPDLVAALEDAGPQVQVVT